MDVHRRAERTLSPEAARVRRSGGDPATVSVREAARWLVGVLILGGAGAVAGGGAPPAAAQEPPRPAAQEPPPTPAAHFGFQPGTNRKLAGWTGLAAYYQRLAAASPRVTLDTLGTSTRGRPFVMLTITSEANHRRLEELHRIQAKLSDPRTIAGAEELGELFDRGRAVVLVTHAIHSTEVGSSQVAPLIAHRLAASAEPRIREILDHVIVLQIPSLNPDGTEWIAEWYDRWVGTDYEGAPLPRLYHHYVGHDNNRDWYAFTQDETRLTVTGAHNEWHPHVVHDVHQMRRDGARIFFPPYVEPWEPNVDPDLTAAVNDLGTWTAARVQEEGRTGVVVSAIYDAFTPARAYSHYHAGARILSETASAELASPVRLGPDDLRPARGFDPTRRSWNFPRPWPGGEWGLPEIVDYMEAGAIALLTHVARNRRDWLETAHGVNRRAVEGWERWPAAWAIPADQPNHAGPAFLLRILRTGDVEVRRARTGFTADDREFPQGTYVVPMRQPYAAFAQTLLEVQDYPDLRNDPGGPPRRPYDATAHTLPLLMDVEAVPLTEPPEVELGDPIPAPDPAFEPPPGLGGEGGTRIGLYRSWQESMEAGWTRWLLDRHEVPYDTVGNDAIRSGRLTAGDYDVLLLQSQEPSSIEQGWSEEEMPPPYTGGLGEEGARAIRSFVRSGGRLVAVEEATAYAIRVLDLEVSNAVERLPEREFFVPGSILHLELAAGHPLARGSGDQRAGWYGRSSRAFEVTDPTVRVVARYGDDPLLSGWMVGREHVAGRPALLEADVGRGDVVLFGFQPNYRGQSVATWPLLFNALGADAAAGSTGGES